MVSAGVSEPVMLQRLATVLSTYKLYLPSWTEAYLIKSVDADADSEDAVLSESDDGPVERQIVGMNLLPAGVGVWAVCTVLPKVAEKGVHGFWASAKDAVGLPSWQYAKTLYMSGELEFLDSIGNLVQHALLDRAAFVFTAVALGTYHLLSPYMAVDFPGSNVSSDGSDATRKADGDEASSSSSSSEAAAAQPGRYARYTASASLPLPLTRGADEHPPPAAESEERRRSGEGEPEGAEDRAAGEEEEEADGAASDGDDAAATAAAARLHRRSNIDSCVVLVQAPRLTLSTSTYFNAAELGEYLDGVLQKANLNCKLLAIERPEGGLESESEDGEPEDAAAAEKGDDEESPSSPTQSGMRVEAVKSIESGCIPADYSTMGIIYGSKLDGGLTNGQFDTTKTITEHPLYHHSAYVFVDARECPASLGGLVHTADPSDTARCVALFGSNLIHTSLDLVEALKTLLEQRATKSLSQGSPQINPLYAQSNDDLHCVVCNILSSSYLS